MSHSTTPTLPDLHPWTLWAKWPRDPNNPNNPNNRRYHPVICHLIDVAFVARLIWTRVLTPHWRMRIANELGLTEHEAQVWCTFWAGLHDIGKASPAFQTQLAKKSDGQLIQSWLTNLGLKTAGAKWAPHGAISLILLEAYLPQFGCSPELAQQVAAFVGAHHGLFFTPGQINEFSAEELIGDDKWHMVQRMLMDLLAQILELPSPLNAPQGTLTPSSIMTLAGFVSISDWLGSNTDYFSLAAPIVPSPIPVDTMSYLISATRAAENALTCVAWETIDLGNSPANFTQLFPGKKPRGVQTIITDLATQLSGPAAIIIEAPTGEGKTEAAVYLADSWSVSLHQSGMYFALPTQATSNQMFNRIHKYLEQRFADKDKRYVNLHLAHGMAALSPEYRDLAERAIIATSSLYDQNIDAKANDPERGAVIAAEWFTALKRTLLSPYGVGTIDQALLAVLQVKHEFVRIFGLSDKTIIMDEVHAYDTYMSTLLVRLLQWLGALGAPVILLSATLPAIRRNELLKAYAEGAGWPVVEFKDTSYPRVTSFSQQGCQSIPIPVTMKTRTLSLRWVDGALPTKDNPSVPLASLLSAAISDGGCVAVICNTVRRAQKMYSAFAKAFERLPVGQRPDLSLLHSQLLHDERLRREEYVLGAFGLDPDGKRNSHRPNRAIVVATQVIEQSLDLDFDLIISDLAPIDLLLQRAGRIHRHDVNNLFRPSELARPMLWVCQPDFEEVGDAPHFSNSDQYIYQPFILLRTWYELNKLISSQGESKLDIPGDVERLIEAVYSSDPTPPTDASPAYAASLGKAHRKVEHDKQKAEDEARRCRILPPWDSDIVTDRSLQLEEDDPAASATIQAHTRDGEPSLPVVVLDAPFGANLKRSIKPTLEQARSLLGQSVSLTHRGILECLLAEPVPSGWAKTPWLRNHRLVILDGSGKAIFHAPQLGKTFGFTLDSHLGIVIENKTSRKEQ